MATKKVVKEDVSANYVVECAYVKVVTPEGELRIERGEVTNLIPSKVANKLVSTGRISVATTTDGEG